MKIITLKRVSSTEDYIRKILKKQRTTREDAVVVAEVQKNGRGTKGREFSSLKGGVYLSYLRFHDRFKAADAFKLNEVFSVAVVKTLLAFGIKSGVKWPNDVYASNKKICGMLINNCIDGEYLDYTIVGIGVNVNNEIPSDLADIAISAKQILGENCDVDAFTATLIFNLVNIEETDLYVRYSIVLGKKIKVIPIIGEPYFTVAEKILDDGRLLCKDGKILSAEEVSVRF